jgi:hypothetical protein
VVPAKVASALADPYYTRRDKDITGPEKVTVTSKKEDKVMATQLDGKRGRDLARSGDRFKIRSVSSEGSKEAS